jgi:LAS superfamily LD-carboxypeptidase LdcB
MKNYILEDDFLEQEMDIDEKIDFYKEQQIQKKLQKRYKFRLFLVFILLSGFFILTLFGLWQLNTFASSQENCQKMLLEKASIGIDTASYSCNIPEIVDGVPNYLLAKQHFSRTQKQVLAKQTELEKEIEEITKEIEEIKNNLEILEFTTKIEEINFEEINLSQKLVQKKTYKRLLESELEIAKVALDDIIYLYNKKIEKNQNEYQIQNFVEFYEQIKRMNENQKIEKYPEIKQKYTDLRSAISDQIVKEKNPDGTRQFDGPGYKKLFESMVWPETKENQDEIVITNNPETDKILIQKALARGYKKQKVVKPEKISKLESNGLFAPASKAYQELEQAAKKEGLNISLNSTYRSVEDQRKLFLERLKSYFEAETGQEFTPEKILTRKYDDVIDRLLKVTAPPGFSRHHTGYTVDLAGSTPVFANSPEFIWMSKDNYANSRKFGFIPSYPPNTPNQGPDPEEWEYIFVGTDVL